jgi:phosphatidylglycerol:prolipoprotein diacylglycerol transferase
VPIAVIALDFDPLLRLGDGLVVRWQTLALAAVMATALIVLGFIARRDGLRLDDLLYLAVGVVPGAVIGARLGYAAIHLEAFAADPPSMLDPARGGLELAGGVAGGALTGLYVLSLLGAPIGRWATAAAFPLLLALGGGKMTMVLGGSGQGLPSDEPWATAFIGPGPWGSLAPALPSHPSQVYEAIGAVGVLVVLLVLSSAGLMRRRDGRILLLAIAGWAVVRAAVATTWRDPVVVGPFGVGGLLAAGLAIVCLVLIVVLAVLARRAPTTGGATSAEPSWPDPATRPRF